MKLLSFGWLEEFVEGGGQFVCIVLSQLPYVVSCTA